MKQKIKLLLLSCLIFTGNLLAQDDLLNMLSAEQPKKPTRVFASFKGSRLVCGQTNETVAAKHLNFLILHRFGEVYTKQDGLLYNYFGLDGAVIRLAFDYGITDKLMVGIGRSSAGKTYDGNIKYKLFQQKTSGMPVSVNYYGNMAINTTTWADTSRENLFSSRLSYCNQLIITRKVNDYISLLLAPTLVHRNLVKYKTEQNDIYALGMGASIKLTRSTRFNIEYYPRLNGRDEKGPDEITPLKDFFGIGFDIETGGHVFQMMFCNGNGMYEQAFITQTTTSWTDYGVRFGFNLSRSFSFDN